MIGNTLKEFMDDLYNNPEKELVYRGKRYAVTGFVDTTGEFYTLEVCTIEIESKTLFAFGSNQRSKCIEAFEKAKIFDGKTIYEAEKDIEVLFG